MKIQANVAHAGSTQCNIIQKNTGANYISASGPPRPHWVVFTHALTNTGSEWLYLLIQQEWYDLSQQQTWSLCVSFLITVKQKSPSDGWSHRATATHVLFCLQQHFSSSHYHMADLFSAVGPADSHHSAVSTTSSSQTIPFHRNSTFRALHHTNHKSMNTCHSSRSSNSNLLQLAK